MDCLPQLKLPLRLKELQENIQEQKVLQSELGTLKKNAKVYRQQQNSNILFLSSLDKEMSRAKNTLDHLQKEYQEMEGSMSAHKGKEENRTDLEQSRPS
ncbi:ASNSD1 upstream open reading frame protein-like isoform X1 [Pomacea canaliculata]|uniref:ASNSD1 upstream open reading frame protein-like isoform X1 n=1 Tax=Pomacea canaliculata TaxID=400727 RepID=UPI000D736CA5|nr:ASNSD1 upstream open reading frame protein-like isoform X1 [Pomacea canaliculata]XP_025098261.1 ASNSD1 upstream open reading frame protein-like isoform X1 [Pomacea canaliculata]